LSDSILELRFDEFHDRFVPLIRSRDYAAAAALCRSYIAIADQAGDAEAGAMFASFLSTALSIAGRDAEALEALELAERYEPAEARHKIHTASYLHWLLARPQDALKKLEEAQPLLQSFGDKTTWDNERGVIALVVGRAPEAIESMRALADPERLAIMRTYISLHYQVDLRLVSKLTESGLARTECVAYLKVAEAVGATSNEPADEAPLKRVRELLSIAQA
jgi:tetratricopeptide (TPR) repeat protein